MRKSILQFLSNYTNKSHQLSESFKLKMKKAYIYIYIHVMSWTYLSEMFTITVPLSQKIY